MVAKEQDKWSQGKLNCLNRAVSMKKGRGKIGPMVDDKGEYILGALIRSPNNLMMILHLGQGDVGQYVR